MSTTPNRGPWWTIFARGDARGDSRAPLQTIPTERSTSTPFICRVYAIWRPKSRRLSLPSRRNRTANSPDRSRLLRNRTDPVTATRAWRFHRFTGARPGSVCVDRKERSADGSPRKFPTKKEANHPQTQQHHTNICFFLLLHTSFNSPQKRHPLRSLLSTPPPPPCGCRTSHIHLPQHQALPQDVRVWRSLQDGRLVGGQWDHGSKGVALVPVARRSSVGREGESETSGVGELVRIQNRGVRGLDG